MRQGGAEKDEGRGLCSMIQEREQRLASEAAVGMASQDSTKCAKGEVCTRGLQAKTSGA